MTIPKLTTKVQRSADVLADDDSPDHRRSLEGFGFDAFSPKEIAERVRTVGVAKARLDRVSMAMLGVLAGGFIGLGGLYAVIVLSDAALGFALGRVLAGVTFSLGLLLIVVAGAELFTGNNLLVMAWCDRRISARELLVNWLVVLGANFVGAAGLALLVFLSGHATMNGGAIAEQYVRIAAVKCSMPFWTAFFRGVLCNALVCIAVWMSLAGRSVVDKAVAIVFPISAFVAAGFEHSVANMYFIPLAILLRSSGVGASQAAASAVTWFGFVHNLAPVVLGNVVGGSVLVGLVYQVIYGRAAGRSARDHDDRFVGSPAAITPSS